MHKGGGAGYYGLPLADAGCPWQLRAGFLLDGFAQYNFLLLDDCNEQASATVQLSATIGSNVELWLLTGARANRSLRPTTDDSSTATATLALGKTAFGIKLHSAWGTLGHVAVQPMLRVQSGPSDFGPSLSSIDGGIDILGSLYLASLWPRLPLRLSFRAGYLYDRSSTLIASLDCMAQGGAECLATRLVYANAYDVGQPRVRLGIGADVHFRLGARALLGPTLSYAVSVVTGDGDAVLRALLMMQAPDLAPSDVESRVAQQLTLGARLLLPWAISLETGLTVALSGFGYAMGPKLPQVSGFGSISMALDPGAPASARSSRAPADADLARPLGALGAGEPGAPIAAPGFVVGVVRDERTKLPLADAVVRFLGAGQNELLTNQHGTYQSGPLPPGPLVIEASRGDHQTARVTVLIRSGEKVAQNLELVGIARLSPATLWVELLPEPGAPLRAPLRPIATLSRAGQGPPRAAQEGQRTEQIVEMAPQPGGLSARLPSGSWRLRIDAVGYLRREQIVVLPSGGEGRLAVRLPLRPQSPRVRLGLEEIQLAEPLHFSDDNVSSQLESGSLRLLDEVLDLLFHHSELRQVRIEAAGPGDELQLIAVRDYLVQNGLAPERVIVAEPVAVRRERSPRILLRIVN